MDKRARNWQAPCSPARNKLAPSLLPRARRASGNRERNTGAGNEGGRGEGGARAAGAYVHTIGTSSQLPPGVSIGTTEQGLALARKRKRTKLVVTLANSLYESGHRKHGWSLLGCGHWFQKRLGPCGSVTELKPIHCDSMFCPGCSNRRSIPLQQKILARCNKSEKSYWLLTLTVPNTSDLTKSFLKEMVESFAALRESEVWTGTVSGGFYSLEATRNEDRRDWHPHLHVLIEVPKVLPMDWVYRVKAVWKALTGAEYVHLDRLYGITKHGKKHGKLNIRGLREVVKYVTKSVAFAASPALVDEFFTAFKSVRRVQAFGSFFGAVEEAGEKLKADEEGKPDEFLLCVCGAMHRRSELRFGSGAVHSSETVLVDGRRHMRFDFASLNGSEAESPPVPVLELEIQEVPIEVQYFMDLFPGVVAPLSNSNQTALAL